MAITTFLSSSLKPFDIIRGWDDGNVFRTTLEKDSTITTSISAGQVMFVSAGKFSLASGTLMNDASIGTPYLLFDGNLSTRPDAQTTGKVLGVAGQFVAKANTNLFGESPAAGNILTASGGKLVAKTDMAGSVASAYPTIGRVISVASSVVTFEFHAPRWDSALS